MGADHYCHRRFVVCEMSVCRQKKIEHMITVPKLKEGSSLFKLSIILIGVFYGAVLLVPLRTFLLWQSANFLLGIVALITATVVRPQSTSMRFAYCAIFFAALSLFVPVKTLLFCGLVCGVFFIVESFFGVLNILPVIIVGIMSPFFQYVAGVFSFPVRLQLTAWAGELLSVTGAKSTVQGNMIHYNGNQFSVDPACMGLNMVVTSLILGISVIGIYQKIFSQTLNILLVGVLLGAVTFFNVISNLFRIICLVQFAIPPGTSMHEIIGILCLVVYVILPSIVLMKWMVRRFGKRKDVEQAVAEKHSFTWGRYIKLHAVVAGSILCSAIIIIQHDSTAADLSAPVLPVKNYAVERISAEIIKLENHNSFIYIKVIPGFYSADHIPAICWRGSGYELRQIQEQIIERTKVYTATLQRQEEILYTSWWYDNGNNRTINQLEWRWNVLKGAEKYSVVNVTSAAKQVLEKETCEILQSRPFDHLLQKLPSGVTIKKNDGDDQFKKQDQFFLLDFYHQFLPLTSS